VGTIWTDFKSVYEKCSPRARARLDAVLREYGVGDRDLTPDEVDQAARIVEKIVRQDRAARGSAER
jgi:hypothetical protein